MEQNNKHQTDKTKRIVIASIAVVVIVGVIASTIFVVMRNRAASELMQAVSSTLDLEQVKFQVNTPTESSSLNVDGLYKKNTGLSANVTSVILDDSIQTTRNGRWVIDNSAATYFNLSSMNAKAIDNSNVDPDTSNKLAIAMQIINTKNKDIWTKLEARKDSNDDTYGLGSCLLPTIYRMQSSTAKPQILIQQIMKSGSLKVSQSSNTVYDVSADSDKLSELSDIYIDSDLYKALISCSSPTYSLTKQQANDLLKKMTLKMTVDGNHKFVNKIEVSLGGTKVLDITVESANNVQITIPKVTEATVANPSETPEQYLQRTSPFLYKNLDYMQQNIQG